MQTRKQELKEIQRRFVPYLHEEGYEDAVKNAPLMDAVAICSKAEEAIRTGLPTSVDEEAYKRAVGKARGEVVYKLRTAKETWAMFDAATKCPWMDENGYAWMFSNKECADVCLFHSAKRRPTLRIIRLGNADTRRFIDSVVQAYGADGILLDNGDDWLRLTAEEVSCKQPVSGIPLARPVTRNPELLRALLLFAQVSMGAGDDNVIDTCAKNVVCAFKKATLLVPAQQGGHGEVRMPTIHRHDKVLLPVFTDEDAFKEAHQGTAWTDAALWKYDDLMGTDVDGFLFNMGSLACVLDRHMLQELTA